MFYLKYRKSHVYNLVVNNIFPFNKYLKYFSNFKIQMCNEALSIFENMTIISDTGYFNGTLQTEMR